MKRSMVFGAFVTVTAACAPGQGAPRSQAADPASFAPAAEERADILSVVQMVFDAIASGDSDLLREALDPDASLFSVRPAPDGGGTIARPSSVAQFAASIASSGGGSVERMWDVEVRVDGPLASVWAPYDFYRGESFSHCGVDAVHLIRKEGGWTIVSLTWNTLQPPACDQHPQGAPNG